MRGESTAQTLNILFQCERKQLGTAVAMGIRKQQKSAHKYTGDMNTTELKGGKERSRQAAGKLKKQHPAQD